MLYASKLPRFIFCAKTMFTWQEGIFNIFKVPYINGYIEGRNKKIKALKRNIFSYRSFKRFRNRILHTYN